MDAQPICTPLTALAVSTYIPWPDDQIGPFWPVNGVTWSISTMGFFYFSFPFLDPRLQRGVPAGQERVTVICLYLLQATWPLLIGSIFFILTDPGMDTPMWYWFVRAYPLCRFPVFMMGCLAGKLMIMHRQHALISQIHVFAKTNNVYEDVRLVSCHLLVLRCILHNDFFGRVGTPGFELPVSINL
jgi:peptidoglycan/LPS O-acetylase OafA/YrhL